MARPMKPLVRSSGYYPSNRWIPLVYAGGYTTVNGGGEPEPPPIEKTITGNPIHITDALAKLVQALSIALEPVQDLNGYSYPWPAGGGKNKFNGTFLQGYWAYADGKWVNSPNWITTEKIPCKASTSYTVSADAKVTRWQGFVWYDSNGDFISTDNLNSNVNIGLTKTSPSNAAYLIFNIAGYPGANDTIAPSDVTHFQLEEGSSSTAYAPYSNICPISGWTGANVTRTGKNLIDIPASVTKDGITFTKDSDGYVTASPSSGDPRSWGKNNAQFLVNLAPGNYKFVIKLKTPSASQYSGWEIYSPTGVKIAGSSGGKFRADEVAAFTASESGNYYIMAKLHTSASRLMVVKDGADTSNYEPYSGDTYSITFPAAAGTVYGGTLDVTTGELTVDRAMVDLGTLTWYTAASQRITRFRAPVIGIKQIGSPNVLGAIVCSSYATKTANQTYTGSLGISLQQNANDVYIYDPQKEAFSAADFKSAMSGVQLVYELATPQTYQLTPTEVTLLLGENNIWSDGEMTLTYLADGNASNEEALNILLGGRYVNNHSEDEPTDREALNIVLGGNER